MPKPRKKRGYLAHLSAEQLGQVDQVLFDEQHTYVEAVQVLKARFGIVASEGSLWAYYKKAARARMDRNLATAAASTVPASGVEVVVQCEQPGRIRLAIRPLHGVTPAAAPATDAGTVRASALEIAVVCQKPGEVRLAVLPLRDEEPAQPGGTH